MAFPNPLIPFPKAFLSLLQKALLLSSSGVFLRWSISLPAAASLCACCSLLSQLLPVSISVTDVRLKRFTLRLSQAGNTYVVIDSSSAETQ